MTARRLAVLVALAMAWVLGACGGGTGEQVDAAEPATTTAPATSSATTTVPPATVAEESPPASTTATAVPQEQPDEEVVTTTAPEPVSVTEPAAVPEGPPIPAVTLELDDGTVFVTAEATRPVLYVFWAEW